MGCLISQGKLDEASAACKEAIRIKPDDIVAHKSLRIILRAQGKVDEAIADSREMIRLKPDDAQCHNDLAWEMGMLPGRSRAEYDEVLLHARKAVELAPKEGYIANTLAQAELRAGHWLESIAAAERSMAINGGSASDRFFLAMAHWQKGGKAEARKWFAEGVAWTKEKDPKNAEFLQFWTEAAKLLGQAAPGPSSIAAPSVKPAN